MLRTAELSFMLEQWVERKSMSFFEMKRSMAASTRVRRDI
jgi:hypothetical protein